MKKTISFILLVVVYLAFTLYSEQTYHTQILGETIHEKPPNGLKFSLSEGSERVENRAARKPAKVYSLSDSETSTLLGRLPKIKTEGSDEVDFAKRAGSLPAPKTGKKIPIRFPLMERRGSPSTNAEKKPLRVLRFAPEGEVALAPDLNVTFSEPMVSVTSLQEASKIVPVQLSPEAKGKWRWLGTKTLIFDTKTRFRMATKYAARVSAGTKSATGQILQKDVVWTFTTPPPKVKRHYPLRNQTTRRDPLMFVAFGQEVDPTDIIESISVTVGGKRLPIRLATKAEIETEIKLTEKDNTKTNLLYYKQNTQPKRWLAFRALNSKGGTENALPAEASIKVTVSKGAPSAEGPLKTTIDQSFTFKTFGSMKSVDGYCNYKGSKKCSPFQTWYLEFSNTIDASSFDESMVKIKPAAEGLSIYPNGRYIHIQGVKKGRTTYKITINESLKDIYRQNLIKLASFKIKVGSAPLSMHAQDKDMVVLDPTAKKPSYSIYSTNHTSARVKVYSVRPKHWSSFQQFVLRRYYDDVLEVPIPGRLISNRIVKIKNKADKIVKTQIDLSRFLKGRHGNIILDITPTKRRGKYDRTRISTWIQSTNIGLDAFVDREELVGFATDLRTGKPLSGVELFIFPNGKKVNRKEIDKKKGSYFLQSRDRLSSNDFSAASKSMGESFSNRTSADGILRLPLPVNQAKQPNILIATNGKDTAFLPENLDYYHGDHGSWHRKKKIDAVRWFVFDDRKVYKPKEEVAVKGYIRKIDGGKLGDVMPFDEISKNIFYSVKDPKNNEISKGAVQLNSFGAIDFKFELPDNANLGYSRVLFYFNKERKGKPLYSHVFQIQEFRRPEFEVSAKVVNEAPHFVGDSVNVEANAKYYAGGGLANAKVEWTVRARATNYTPPNREDYIFGSWEPWWRKASRSSYDEENIKYLQSFTDVAGKHNLKIDFESVKPPRPYFVDALSAVQDVNRQTWSRSTSLLVHPSDLYVGIRSRGTFVQKNENIEIESIVSDLEGKLVAGRKVEIKAVSKAWRFESGEWKEKIVDQQLCVVKSTSTSQKCKFIAKNGGRYVITASVMDDKKSFNESEMIVWVAGGETAPNKNVNQEQVELVPSQKTFKPGDVAEILVMSPFTPAEGVLTLRRSGIVKTEKFTMKTSSITLKVPVEESYLPNIYAQVDLVGAASRTNEKGEVLDKLARRPAYAMGSLNLSISKASRELRVKAEPQDKSVEPSGKTNIDVEIKDNFDNPVSNTEVTVVVVDESILALSGYKLANPLDIFYKDRDKGTKNYHLREYLILDDADYIENKPLLSGVEVDSVYGTVEVSAAMAQLESDPRGDMAAKTPARRVLRKERKDINDFELDRQGQIKLRKNFSALAVFAPDIKTDLRGRATIPVELPGSLTRYRVMAVSVDKGKRFGKGESSITVKKPLMVRPSAPRFMNFGDKIKLPVVVQNQTDNNMTVDVGIRSANADLMEGSGRRVMIKANDRAEVRFPVSAQKAGTAHFQFAVSSGKYSDAAEIKLPVWTPATTEAFATYGTTDQNEAIIHPVQAPNNIYSQFGGLEITTSSTQLQELTDAFIYLYNYRFECSEQVASRMISIAALKDVLTAFKAEEMPSKAAIEESFARDISILSSRQNSNGYFGLWKRSGERYKYPFVTAHVAHALVLAKAKGYEVPEIMLRRVKPYLKNIEKHYDKWHKLPSVQRTISAYALYVRNLMGDNDEKKAKRLLAKAKIEKMPFEALGWIMSVLIDGRNSQAEINAIKRFLMNRVNETAATAQFNTNYGDGEWLIMHSNRRADGILLEAIIKAGGEKTNLNKNANFSGLIPKLVRSLLNHRKKGRWSNTQENVFILLALDKYFQQYEKVTPNFVNQIWLGDSYAGQQKFAGRAVDSSQLTISMDYLTKQGRAADLVMSKQGVGRLYYRIGMKYAPKNLKLKPADYGFTVLRTYEAVDKADDVKQGNDGKWTIKAGARVRVKLIMVAQARRYHVALVDPLPAGLEILNPELAITESIPARPLENQNTTIEADGSPLYKKEAYWRPSWFEHQNLRDERAEAFSSLLRSGVYSYTYVARATTPGDFVAPPAKAEEMYNPETFGRSGTDFVRVE